MADKTEHQEAAEELKWASWARLLWPVAFGILSAWSLRNHHVGRALYFAVAGLALWAGYSLCVRTSRRWLDRLSHRNWPDHNG